MKEFNRKEHWENIYQSKKLEEVGWYQKTPATSLDFIKKFEVQKSARIIDIGGGDSYFVDHLLKLGFENITVLDISEFAIKRAKKRLGDKANHIKWIVADVATFSTNEKYDFWHDRAAFHFLTEENDIEKYIQLVQNSLSSKGVLVVGTFSDQGPKKCSGIEIKQYSEVALTNRLDKFFKKIKCITIDHKTPSDKIQNFLFCSFKKRSSL